MNNILNDTNVQCYICGGVITNQHTQNNMNNQTLILQGELYDGRIVSYCVVCYKSLQEGLKTYRQRKLLKSKMH